MANLATLTAQRPTLHDLLRQAERAPLLNYLQTLQAGAELDLILICSAEGDVVAQTGRTPFERLCQTGQAAGFYVVPAGGAEPVWLYAAHPVVDRSEQVIAGLTLDHRFNTEMRAETGLEHIIRIAGQSTAAGSDNSFLAPPLFLPAAGEAAGRMTFTLAEQPYYAAAFPLSPASAATGQAVDLEAVVALPVANIAAAQQHLVWVMGGGIALVIAGGSLVGTLLARRISQPLAHLTKAAAALSRGDLDSPVVVETQVREVVLVAQALEQARLDLQRTLTDLRYEKMWTDHLLTAMVEGIVTLDRHKRLTFFSPGAERITGWRREEVLGRSCDEVFQTVDTEEPFSRSIPRSGKRRKITVLLAAGEQATLAVTGAFLNPPETKEASVALVFRDVSEEEVVHRLMGHFLANVAHEFRTPLSALAASAELLLDQAVDLRDLLTSLHLGILSLQTLVDNLLESASIETGRFRVHSRPCSQAKPPSLRFKPWRKLRDTNDKQEAIDTFKVANECKFVHVSPV